MASTADGTTISWASGGPFGIVPVWILENEGLSDRAVRLYGILARLANNDTQSTAMTRKALAAKLCCAPSTLDVALKELRDAGAVTTTAQTTARGDRDANRYHVHISPASGERSTGADSDPSTEEPVGNKGETSKSEKEKALASFLPRDAPPAIKKVDGQNEPLNALMAECGVDPGNQQRVRWAVAALNGKAGTQGIRQLFWLEACRYAEAHPEFLDRLSEVHDEPEAFSEALVTAIRRKAAKYRETMKGARLTPTALRDWWLDLELQRKPSDGMTREEMLAFRG